MNRDPDAETDTSRSLAGERVLPEWLVVGAGLSMVALVRLLPFPNVFRGEDVILTGNDPWAYRTLVESITARLASPFSVDAYSNIGSGEPLLVAVLGFIAALFGGGDAAVGVILAVYPPVSAVVSGVVVYAIGKRVSGDARVAIAGLALFAVVPGHALRTGLGFADHHAFDYLWLTLTFYGLIGAVTTPEGDRRRWWFSALLGLSVAAQTLAWEAGPLLLVPLAAAIAVAGPVLLRDDCLSRLVPVVTGLAAATGLTLLGHLGLGWQSTATSAAPLALFFGAIALYAAASIVRQYGRRSLTLLLLEVVGVVAIAFVVTRSTLFADALDAGLDRLFVSTTIAETTALGGGFGPVLGPIIMLGFAGAIGLPVVVWTLWQSYRQPSIGWLLLDVYVCYFLMLALVQRRFVGELAPFVAVVGGYGLVWILTQIADLQPLPVERQPLTSDRGRRSASSLAVPDRRRFLATGALSLTFVAFPAVNAAALHSRVRVRPSMYRAANWLGAYADQQRLAWPKNYVFSRWGDNRFYNYLVNGHARSYRFARENYLRFLLASEPGEWYERLDDRVGFVVVDYLSSDLHAASMYERLFETYGSRTGRVDGVEHYRAIYVGDTGRPKVYQLVQGATLTGVATARQTIELTTRVSIPGASFTYERRIEADEDGNFEVVVPYSGRYEVGETTVRVPESAIDAGETVTVDYWRRGPGGFRTTDR